VKRLRWLLPAAIILVWLVVGGPLASLSSKTSEVQQNDNAAFLPASAESTEVLGIHAVGNGAGDIIAEAALAIEMGALADDVGLTIHAHPTLPEAIMEACKAAVGEAVHIQNR